MEPLTLPTTKTQSTKPTFFVDASLLKKASCIREVIWTTGLGLQAGASWSHNYKAGYGSAFHRGIEYYYSLLPEKRTEELSKVVEIAQDYYTPFVQYISQSIREFRTTEHLLNTMVAYHELYGGHDALTPIKVPGVNTGLLETRFYHPWYQGEKFDIILVGTIDMIAEYYGEMVIVDHKTTSGGGEYQGGPEGYFANYKMSIQAQFYVWVFEQLAKQRLKFLVNGIFLKKPTKKSQRFDGVILQRSSPFVYDDEQMNSFIDWATHKLFMIKNWLAYVVDNVDITPEPDYSSCQQQFGRCKFFDICALPKSQQGAAISAMQTHKYNPLTFSDQ